MNGLVKKIFGLLSIITIYYIIIIGTGITLPEFFENNAEAAISLGETGDCGAQGDNVKYSLDMDGTLTISGTGSMADFGSYTAKFNGTTIKSVIIENGVTSIGNYTFYNCRATSFSIPSSVTKIGNNAFRGCIALTSISIPGSVTTLEEYIFYGCTNLTNITIPNSVSVINKGAFYNCKALTDVIIPSSVTSLGDAAFESCTELNYITFMSKTTTLNNSGGIFKSCSKLVAIRGYDDSTAEAYAKANGHPFESLTPTPAPTQDPVASTDAPVSADGVIPSGMLIGTGANLEIIGAQLIRVELPIDTSMMDFMLDPDNLMSKVDSDFNIDPDATLLFINKDDDGDIYGMSGRSDQAKFTNKGRMPVNVSFKVKAEASFNETDSTVNLVEKRSDLDGRHANIYLAANLPEWEDIPVGAPGGAVINALIPDSRNNYLLNYLGDMKVEYEENGDDWNSLGLYFTGEVDVLYTKWDDTVDPNKLSNAKYTAVWELTAVPSAPNMLDTYKGPAKNVTVPLTGADPKATKKIYIKPMNGTLVRKEDIMADAEGFAAEDIRDFIKIQKDNIVLNDNFAQYCKGRWGTCRVLIYAPGTQGVIAAVR